MPVVSVIIPVYNGAAEIEAAIRSVLAQSFQDYEIIVIDDGSSDNSAEVIKSIPDERIKYRYQANQGAAAARNNGIHCAQGEFLAFLDCDDLWLPPKLELQLHHFQEKPGIGLVYCSALFIDAENNITRCQTAKLNGDVFDALLMGNFIVNSSVMIPREVFALKGIFNESIHGSEDWEMWLRITSALPVAAIREPLVVYNNHLTGHGKNYYNFRKDALIYINEAFNTYASHKKHLRLKAIANVHYGVGVGLGTLGILSDSRKELIQALKMNPLLFSAYWRLLLSFGGTKLNREGRKLKNNLSGWLTSHKLYFH